MNLLYYKCSQPRITSAVSPIDIIKVSQQAGLPCLSARCSSGWRLCLLLTSFFKPLSVYRILLCEGGGGSVRERWRAGSSENWMSKFNSFIPKHTEIGWFWGVSQLHQQITTQDTWTLYLSHVLLFSSISQSVLCPRHCLHLSLLPLFAFYLVSVLLSALHQSAHTVVVFLTRAHCRLAYISSLSATSHLIL